MQDEDKQPSKDFVADMEVRVDPKGQKHYRVSQSIPKNPNHEQVDAVEDMAKMFANSFLLMSGQKNTIQYRQ